MFEHICWIQIFFFFSYFTEGRQHSVRVPAVDGRVHHGDRSEPGRGLRDLPEDDAGPAELLDEGRAGRAGQGLAHLRKVLSHALMRILGLRR